MWHAVVVISLLSVRNPFVWMKNFIFYMRLYSVFGMNAWILGKALQFVQGTLLHINMLHKTFENVTITNKIINNFIAHSNKCDIDNIAYIKIYI